MRRQGDWEGYNKVGRRLLVDEIVDRDSDRYGRFGDNIPTRMHIGTLKALTGDKATVELQGRVIEQAIMHGTATVNSPVVVLAAGSTAMVIGHSGSGGGAPGAPGQDGTSILMDDPVPTYSALPVNPPKGTTILVEDEGDLYFWDGIAWTNTGHIVGTGIQILSAVSTPGDLPPTGNTKGDLRYVTSTGDLYTWDGDSWNNVGHIQGTPGPPGDSLEVTTATTPPVGTGAEGDIWINSDTNEMWVWTEQGVWEPVGGPSGPPGPPGEPGEPGPPGGTAIVDPIEPTSPEDGTIWINPDTGITQIWDEDNNEWVISSSGGGGGGTDSPHIIDPAEPVAPTDGLLWTNPDETATLNIPLGYVHNQPTPTSLWTINHPLSFRPNIAVMDSTGEEVEGEVIHVNAGTITVGFSAPFSGMAYLS